METPLIALIGGARRRVFERHVHFDLHSMRPRR